MGKRLVSCTTWENNWIYPSIICLNKSQYQITNKVLRIYMGWSCQIPTFLPWQGSKVYTQLDGRRIIFLKYNLFPQNKPPPYYCYCIAISMDIHWRDIHSIWSDFYNEDPYTVSSDSHSFWFPFLRKQFDSASFFPRVSALWLLEGLFLNKFLQI